ncbi:MAG: response regulator [Bacteroidales bacterium]|nr:response regulator [Bacteroidales bacterium]
MRVLNLEDKNILVVEDDEMSFIYLSQIFRITKGNINRAKNGRDAVELACSLNDLDLILMDLQLPDITGLEATRKIRKHHPDIPIIAQTAARTPEEHEEAKKAGCTDLIEKPFKMEELLEIIHKYLELQPKK